MRNKNGFTLVELLAVIVILAIIMIISIPAVLNTMVIAREKTFGEFVTKVYTTAQKKYMEDELANGVQSYVKYDIKTDLGITSTGDFKGYVVFINKNDDTTVYIGLSDKEYHTVTKYGNNAADTVNYINYTLGGEPKLTDYPVLFDGTQNYFMKGSVDDFNLPTEEEAKEIATGNGGNVIDISEPIKPEKAFENEANRFFAAAKKKFNQEKDDTSLMYISHEPCNAPYEGIPAGTRKIANYPISYILPESNSKGFIIIISEVYNVPGMGEVTNDMYILALKDKYYHTSNRLYAYSYATNSKRNLVIPAILQYEMKHKKNSLSLVKKDSISVIDLDKRIQEKTMKYGAQMYGASNLDESYEYSSLMNEELMNEIQYYVSNDYDDGMKNDDRYFNLQDVITYGLIDTTIGPSPM